MRTISEKAVADGVRRAAACAVLGVSEHTFERWRHDAAGDQRRGPRERPANPVTADERATLLATENSAPYCDLSPHQIVPRLADAGPYLAADSTKYRMLRQEQQLPHRGRTAVPLRRVTPSHKATGSNQMWSSDSTSLKNLGRGVFWYFFLRFDI
jgi:hypothetical protein